MQAPLTSREALQDFPFVHGVLSDSYPKLMTNLNSLLRKAFLNSKVDTTLDIGAGTGELTSVLARYTKSLKIIEPNLTFCQQLGRQFPKADIQVSKFEHAKIAQQMNIILLSHVMYYFHVGQWNQIAQRCRNFLSEQGRLFLIMWSLDSRNYQIYSDFSSRSKECLCVENASKAFLSAGFSLENKVKIRSSVLIPKKSIENYFEFLMLTEKKSVNYGEVRYRDIQKFGYFSFTDLDKRPMALTYQIDEIWEFRK